MAVKFNPFTGQLQIDEKGSGGGGGPSYIDGEVQNFSALPQTIGSPAVDSAYLVRQAEGAWLLNRKPAGIYIRTANTGTRASDWTYAGEFPDVFNDANFVLYDNGDSTKNLQFQLSGISSGTTRTLTVPNKNITIADNADIPTASTATPSALGVAAAGTSANFARADHVHAMPSASDVGAPPTSRTISAGTGLSGGGDLSANRTLSVSFGSSAGTVCEGNDARLSDSRTPTAHAVEHAFEGSDQLFDQDLNTTSDVNFAKITLTAPNGGEAIRIDGVDPSGGDTGFAVYNTTGTQANSFYFNVNGEYVGIGVGAGEGYIQANVPLALPSIKDSLVIRDGDGGQTATFDADGNLTANRTYDLPDASGTLALTSDIPANTIASTLVDAKGDLIVGTAADTVARLPVGTTNGHVLTVDSAEASGMKWAAASGGVTSVTGTAPIVSSGGTTPAISVTVGTTAGTVAAGDHTHTQLHDRSHAITSTSDHTAGNHKVFYSNGSGEIVELSLGSSGTVLTSNGATSAPSFAAASGGISAIGASAADILSVSGSDLVADDLGADKLYGWDDSAGKAIGFTIGSGLTVTDDTITASGGVGGGSGSVDNAIIRADGTGGSTVQSSAINILDASTTTQNNVAITNDHSGQTNSALVLTPKGTGAFIVGPRPDGTSTGGNARGARAINIAMTRTAANQVAEGSDSIAIGNGSRASGTDSIAMGGGGATAIRAVAICPTQGTGSGDNAVCIGYNALASFAGSVAVGANAVSNTGNYSVALGDSALARSGNSFGCLRNSAADADNSISIGRESSVTGVNSISLGAEVISTLRGVFSTRMFNAIYWGGQTTTNAATILNLDATATNRFTIAANTALAVDVLLVARRSDVADKWLVARRFLGIRRDGSNNTSLIGAVQTLGTDQSEGSPTWSFALTADDTNEALRLEVTGATSETVQWRATAFYRVV